MSSLTRARAAAVVVDDDDVGRRIKFIPFAIFASTFNTGHKLWCKVNFIWAKYYKQGAGGSTALRELLNMKNKLKTKPYETPRMCVSHTRFQYTKVRRTARNNHNTCILIGWVSFVLVLLLSIFCFSIGMFNVLTNKQKLHGVHEEVEKWINK